MPKLNNTAELQAEALKRKQERDRLAQANWVAKNKEVHLERMREQYQKKKAKLLAEKVARGEVPVVKPVPVVAVQPPNQLKNGTIDNSTLADAIQKIKDDYARVRLYKVHGEHPTAEEKEDFMLKLFYPADLVVKNKSKLTPAHLTQIEELGQTIHSILHHKFVVKKTRKLKVKVDTSEREARERAMMEAEDKNAIVPEPKPKRKLKKILIADDIIDTDEDEDRDKKKVLPEERYKNFYDGMLAMSVIDVGKFDNKQVEASLRKYFTDLPMEKWLKMTKREIIAEWYKGDKTAQAWRNKTKEESDKAWDRVIANRGRR